MENVRNGTMEITNCTDKVYVTLSPQEDVSGEVEILVTSTGNGKLLINFIDPCYAIEGIVKDNYELCGSTNTIRCELKSTSMCKKVDCPIMNKEVKH